MIGVRLDFYTDAIMIYKYDVGYLKGMYYSFLRRAAYSDVIRCKYDLRQASRSSSHGAIEMRILEQSRPSGSRPSDHFWKVERLEFGLKDLSVSEIREMYDWLCDMIRANGGKV